MKMRKEDKNNQRFLLRAGLIMRTPGLFDPMRKNLDEIFSLINTYIQRKDYQVIKGGLNAVYSIVFKYIEVRNGTFFPSSIISAYDLSSDRLLNEVFEKLAAVHRIAAKDKDLELSKSVIECFSNIAIKCIDINYRATSLSEFTHSMLAAQYMQQSIEEGLNADLLDVGISGSENHKKIGFALIAKNAHTDVRMIIEHLSKVAMYGIIKPKATFLISYPLQAYSLFIRAFVFYKPAYDEFLPQSILEKAQSIITLYVKMSDLVASPLSMELQYALGPFVDLSNREAMPYIFSEAYNKIIDKKTNKEEKKAIIGKVLKFGHEVWHFYDAVSKAAAEKQSFLIHFIDSNLHHITLSLLALYQSGQLGDEEREKALEDIRWVISDYWRIYDYHKEITTTFEMQILENLLEIGYRFNSLGLNEELYAVIDIIISIACSFLEKQKNSYGFDSIRILEKAVYLCILNGTQDIKNKFIKAVKDRFWSKYIEKFPQLKTRLFEELSQVNPDEARRDAYTLHFEDTLIAKLEKDKIDLFVTELKQALLAA